MGLSVMRIQGVVILLAAFGAGQAQASSIETLDPTDATPSIISLGEDVAIDPSTEPVPLGE